MTSRGSILDWKEWREHLSLELREARDNADTLLRYMNMCSRVAESDVHLLDIMRRYEEALDCLCDRLAAMETK